MPKVIIVDEKDQIIGSEEKLAARKKGLIRRVSRILLFNDQGEFLIHKRAPGISLGNRWNQSASGHVDEGESYEQAAYRELEEELGLADIKLEEVDYFYNEETATGRRSSKFNKVYRGLHNDQPINPDSKEISEIKWINRKDLDQRIVQEPEAFREGFILTWQRYNNKFDNINR